MQKLCMHCSSKNKALLKMIRIGRKKCMDIINVILIISRLYDSTHSNIKTPFFFSEKDYDSSFNLVTNVHKEKHT